MRHLREKLCLESKMENLTHKTIDNRSFAYLYLGSTKTVNNIFPYFMNKEKPI